MSEWTTSRKDMDSFTANENGETAHVVYLYPPDDEPRIAVFGTNPRKRAEEIIRAVNTFDQAREALKLARRRLNEGMHGKIDAVMEHDGDPGIVKLLDEALAAMEATHELV